MLDREGGGGARAGLGGAEAAEQGGGEEQGAIHPAKLNKPSGIVKYWRPSLGTARRFRQRRNRHRHPFFATRRR
ncbi:hypothetical protein GCM10008939_21680 [Deinococcus aquiradiocola]|uniref:Uncharacterized protein n=1 Tax=Deinococcus aquiradiocola TaxID=393059 RepID=A0A917PGZ2_9DEIO|nr:hypothetical protein GCM10008939_21680 [Deinococcus aquiradiocola]